MSGPPLPPNRAQRKPLRRWSSPLHGSERGHSITGILEGLPASVAVPEAVLDAARDPDQVYVTSRYPNGFAAGIPADSFSEKTSRRLLDHARAILAFCRGEIH